MLRPPHFEQRRRRAVGADNAVEPLEEVEGLPVHRLVEARFSKAIARRAGIDRMSVCTPATTSTVRCVSAAKTSAIRVRAGDVVPFVADLPLVVRPVVGQVHLVGRGEESRRGVEDDAGRCSGVKKPSHS